MEDHDSKKRLTVYDRINAVMREVHGVERTERHAQRKYSFASHWQINDALKRAMVANGLVQSASVVGHKVADGTVFIKVLYEVISSDGVDRHSVHTVSCQPSTANAGKVEAQQFGMALSYAVKAAQYKLFMLSDRETPDSDEGLQHAPQSARAGFPPAKEPESLPQLDHQQLLAQYMVGLREAGSLSERAKVLAQVERHQSLFLDGELSELRAAAVEAKQRILGGGSK